MSQEPSVESGMTEPESQLTYPEEGPPPIGGDLEADPADEGSDASQVPSVVDEANQTSVDPASQVPMEQVSTELDEGTLDAPVPAEGVDEVEKIYAPDTSGLAIDAPDKSLVGPIPPGPIRDAPVRTVTANLQPNAQAGQAYLGRVGLEGLTDVHLVDPAGSMLECDPATGELQGTPLEVGDFEVHLEGLVDGQRLNIVANLAVLPDPRSLWTNIPSDPKAPFWKADQYFERAEGHLLCIGASKRGRSHAREGTCRDDHFGFLAGTEGGWHIAVVADGAGSAEFSRKGSKVAVERVLDVLPGLLQSEVDPLLDDYVIAYLSDNPKAVAGIRGLLYKSLVAAAFEAAERIETRIARDHRVHASLFSTTLIVCVVKQVASGDWFFGGFSVGDGGAAVFDLDDEQRPLTTLTLPDSGEFAGQTRFLNRSEFTNADDVIQRVFIDVRPRFTALALMTDGITDPKFPTEVVFGDPNRWRDFWQDFTGAIDLQSSRDTEAQFMQWMDFWSPGNHDDRTLVVLVPREED